MKNVRTLITVCLLLAAGAFAQMENQLLMTVTVPFNFSVEDHSLPAGEYNIFTALPERMIRIASTDGQQSAVVHTLPQYSRVPSAKTYLLFHRYGDEYFLAAAWTAGQDVGRNPISSKRAMEFARSGSSLRTITVLAEASHR